MTLVEHYLLPAMLFLLMFAMGLSLTLANFVDLFRYRTALVVGVASLAFLVPAIGLALAHSFPLAPLLAVGVLLTAACPGGTFSNLLTHYARGDRERTRRPSDGGPGSAARGLSNEVLATSRARRR